MPDAELIESGAGNAFSAGVAHLLRSTKRVKQKWNHSLCRYELKPESGHSIASTEDWAREYLNFTGGCLAAWDEAAAAHETRMKAFGAEIEKLPYVRLPASLLFQVRDMELATRDFRTHVALLSLLGQDSMRRACWQEISVRSSGHLRRPTHPQAKGLSRWQIDDSLEVLRGRGLWTVVNYRKPGKRGGGERWFSNRLDVPQLVAAVSDRKLNTARKARLAAAKRAEDEAWATLSNSPFNRSATTSQSSRNRSATSPANPPATPSA